MDGKMSPLQKVLNQAKKNWVEPKINNILLEPPVGLSLMVEWRIASNDAKLSRQTENFYILAVGAVVAIYYSLIAQ
jgi:hypothetical protein